LNHANLGWDYGPLEYVLNNPKMHIWHHAKELPAEHQKGANFGLSLSVWDYLFGTNYIPSEGQNIDLGFEDIESYPDKMYDQLLEPFRTAKSDETLDSDLDQ
jgi:sterol desaturase/sphingolipid hydroxylase (fatty acid hydroxylase superfamily)